MLFTRVISVLRASARITSTLCCLLAAKPVTVHAANTWQAEPSLNTARNQFAGGVIDGRIYVFGGNGNPNEMNLKSIEMLDPAASSWIRLAPNEHNNGQGVEEVSAAVMNGTLYVFGAYGGGIPYGEFNFVEEFDPATNAWTSKAPMPTLRTEPPAVTYNNRIYLFWGGEVETSDRVDAYDPGNNTWEFVTRIPEKLDFSAVAVVADNAYVFGGLDLATGQFVDHVSVYNFLTGTWTSSSTTLPAPRLFYRCAAPVLNGEIYLLSAFKGTSLADAQVSSSLDIYDTVSNTLRAGLPLPTPTAFGLSVIANNKLYVVGGDDETHGIDNEVITDKVWSLDLVPPIGPGELVAPLIEVAGGNVEFTIQPSVSGRRYQLQQSDTLEPDHWIDVGPVRLGDGANLVITILHEPAVPRRFYRLVLDPIPAPEDSALIPAQEFQRGAPSSPPVGNLAPTGYELATPFLPISDPIFAAHAHEP